MLDEIINGFKEADIGSLRKEVEEFCEILGEDVPKTVRDKLKLAEQISLCSSAKEIEQQLSLTELEDIKALVERAVQLKKRKERLLRFHDLIESSVGKTDWGDLALHGKGLLMHFSAELLLGSSLSPEALDNRCSTFADDFRTDYVSYHNAWHTERRSVGRRYPNLRRRAKALTALNTIPQLGKAIGTNVVGEIMALPEELVECGTLTINELGFAPKCPRCGLPYRGLLSWKRFYELEKEIAAYLPQKLDALAVAVADIIVQRQPEDPLRAFIDAVNVSDLDNLCVILTDDVLKTVRDILE